MKMSVGIKRRSHLCGEDATISSSVQSNMVKTHVLDFNLKKIKTVFSPHWT